MRLNRIHVATAAAALLLTSCGSSPPTAPDLPDEPSPWPMPATALTPTATQNASTVAPAPTASARPAEQPVATRRGSIEKVAVTATLYPVLRSGDTATANLQIVSQDPGQTFMLLDSLGDGNTETASKSLTSVDGLRLIDTAAKQAYLPAVTTDGACVCSPDDAGTSDYSSSTWVTVTFAAPPATVTTLNVSVPHFGTFNDVPVL